MLFQNLFQKSTQVGQTLDEALQNLDDFDILLFRGQNYWFSYIVEYFTWSDFSHVGIFLNGATEIKPGLTKPLMFESGYERIPDAIEDRIKWGVQISDLQKVVDNYDGKVYYRKLNISEELRQKAKEGLAAVYQKIAEAPYDYNLCDLMRAEFDIDVGDVQKTDEFFCSALVAYVYAKLGLLSPQTAWDLITPKDFGNDVIDQKLLEGASFGPLTQIK